MRKIMGALLAVAGLAAPATAAETITYSYDARGRLIQIARTGTVNNGVTTSYQFDKGRQPGEQDHQRLPQPAASLTS